MVYQSSNARAMSKSIQTTRGQTDANLNESHKHRNGASYNNSTSTGTSTTSNTTAHGNNQSVILHRPQTRHSQQHDENSIKTAIAYRQQQTRRESFTAMPNQQKSTSAQQRSHSVTALSHTSHAHRQIAHSNETVNMNGDGSGGGGGGRQQMSNEAGLYRNNHSFTMNTNSMSLVDIYANDLAEVMDIKLYLFFVLFYGDEFIFNFAIDIKSTQIGSILCEYSFLF